MQLHDAPVPPTAALAGLLALAAEQEIVLVGTHHYLAGVRLPALRKALAPHSVVALVVDDHVPPLERALIAGLLNDGHIPMILSSGDLSAAGVVSWLNPAPHPRLTQCGTSTRPAKIAGRDSGVSRPPARPISSRPKATA